jgi:hypothetical protein
MKLTKEKIALLVNARRDERVYACSRSFKSYRRTSVTSRVRRQRLELAS